MQEVLDAIGLEVMRHRFASIADEMGVESRRSRIYGGRAWVRLGAVELRLYCPRRYLQGLPITERTDFERE